MAMRRKSKRLEQKKGQEDSVSFDPKKHRVVSWDDAKQDDSFLEHVTFSAKKNNNKDVVKGLDRQEESGQSPSKTPLKSILKPDRHVGSQSIGLVTPARRVPAHTGTTGLGTPGRSPLKRSREEEEDEGEGGRGKRHCGEVGLTPRTLHSTHLQMSPRRIAYPATSSRLLSPSRRIVRPHAGLVSTPVRRNVTVPRAFSFATESRSQARSSPTKEAAPKFVLTQPKPSPARAALHDVDCNRPHGCRLEQTKETDQQEGAKQEQTRGMGLRARARQSGENAIQQWAAQFRKH